MSSVRKSWDRLPEDQKDHVKNQLIRFFNKELDEEIGVIAAESILNFFLQQVGPTLYNQGVSDAKLALEKRMDDLNYDLDDLIEYQ
jgi:uncharacterized protein (DUF2164 family)